MKRLTKVNFNEKGEKFYTLVNNLRVSDVIEKLGELEDKASGINRIHIKKLTQLYFDYVERGIKTFELRKNDCDYKVGNHIYLCEYDDTNDTFTGRAIFVKITYMLEDYEGIQDGYCILGIEVQ